MCRALTVAVHSALEGWTAVVGQVWCLLWGHVDVCMNFRMDCLVVSIFVCHSRFYKYGAD
jgi:hypothetical protein